MASVTQYKQSDIDSFTGWLRRKIPLVQAMGVEKLSYDGCQFCMYAPLAENVNDKGTGFGGSLSAIATLSGWCLVTLFVRQHGYDLDVVVKESQQQFLLPVKGDFYARVSLPEHDICEQVLQRLGQGQRAKMDLIVEVIQGGEVAMRLTGCYVAFKKAS